MIKCIVSDMDGTLLNPDQEISALNRQAINEALEEGVHFLIATGRSYKEANIILEESGIHCPIITGNGAEVRSETGEVKSSTPIDKETAIKIGRSLQKQGIYFEIYTNKGKVTEDYQKSLNVIVDIYKSANEDVPLEQIERKVKERFSKGMITLVDSYEGIYEDDSYQFYKFIVFSRERSQLDEISDAFQHIDDITITSSGSDNIEINHIDAQKGIALKQYLEDKDIHLEDTMAIGDNFNDLSMLKVVGYPFAMQNGEKAIKDYCSYQAESNREDGVGKAIYKMIGVKNR